MAEILIFMKSASNLETLSKRYLSHGPQDLQ